MIACFAMCARNAVASTGEAKPSNMNIVLNVESKSIQKRHILSKVTRKNFVKIVGMNLKHSAIQQGNDHVVQYSETSGKE